MVEADERVREAESTARVEAWSAWSLGGCHGERERGRGNGALEAVTERKRRGRNVFS